MAIFPPLSQFVMVMFEGRPLARLCAFSDCPAASTVFVANFGFVPASHPIGRQM